MNVYGQKVMLRAMEPEDMKMLCETINDPKVEMMVGGWSFPNSYHAQMQWYEQAVQDHSNHHFIVETLEYHQAIGMINLGEID